MLFAGLAVASGHNVPRTTFLSIAAYSTLGILVTIGSLISLKKMKK
jgi:hypothetical protein